MSFTSSTTTTSTMTNETALAVAPVRLLSPIFFLLTLVARSLPSSSCPPERTHPNPVTPPPLLVLPPPPASSLPTIPSSSTTSFSTTQPANTSGTTPWTTSSVVPDHGTPGRIRRSWRCVLISWKRWRMGSLFCTGRRSSSEILHVSSGAGHDVPATLRLIQGSFRVTVLYWTFLFLSLSCP